MKLRLEFIALVVLVAACGARTEIAGGTALDDAGVSPLDALPPQDGEAFALGDASSADAVMCTLPDVILGGPAPTVCKVDITWMCGSTTYRVGGACDQPDADWPDGALVGAYGVCDINGTQVSSFTTATCSCDGNAWVALAMKECPGTHQ